MSDKRGSNILCCLDKQTRFEYNDVHTRKNGVI